MAEAGIPVFVRNRLKVSAPPVDPDDVVRLGDVAEITGGAGNGETHIFHVTGDGVKTKFVIPHTFGGASMLMQLSSNGEIFDAPVSYNDTNITVHVSPAPVVDEVITLVVIVAVPKTPIEPPPDEPPPEDPGGEEEPPPEGEP